MTHKQKTTLKQFITALLLVIICLLADNVNAQTKVKTDAKGNFIAFKREVTKAEVKDTGKTFTTSKGETYPVYISDNGKYYVVRISKTGNEYKQYLKID